MNSKKFKYDVIWYWTGGREVGKWRPASLNTSGSNYSFGQVLKEGSMTLDRAGYVNHPGTLAIGPPEGPPDDSEFKRLGL